MGRRTLMSSAKKTEQRAETRRDEGASFSVHVDQPGHTWKIIRKKPTVRSLLKIYTHAGKTVINRACCQKEIQGRQSVDHLADQSASTLINSTSSHRSFSHQHAKTPSIEAVTSVCAPHKQPQTDANEKTKNQWKINKEEEEEKRHGTQLACGKAHKTGQGPNRTGYHLLQSLTLGVIETSTFFGWR